MSYLFLVFVAGSIDPFKIAPINSTLILLFAALIMEIVVSLAIRSIITKKENKDYWCVAKEDKKNEDVPEALPYNKKNFILKWFLCGVGNKISSATKVLTWVKNIVYISFQILCAIHLILFRIFIYRFIETFFIVVIVLQLLASVPEYLRHKK